MPSQDSVAPGKMVRSSSLQSILASSGATQALGVVPQIVKSSPSLSKLSSQVPLQSLSTPSQDSVWPGNTAESLSLQSRSAASGAWQSLGVVPHTEKSSSSTSEPSSQLPLQSLSLPSQCSGAPGKIV